MPTPIANQIYDLKTPGIPQSFELAADRAETGAARAEGYAADAAASAEESADHAAASLASAQDAEAAADEAELWATAKAGISLGPDEPPDATAGSVWLQTQEAGSTVITAIKRFEADAAGDGLFPGSATYPGSDTYPNKMGDWSSYTLAAALVS